MFRKSYETPRTAQIAAIPDTVQINTHPNLEGVKVLVVDDERDARAMISMALQTCGAQVEAAHNADEAISVAGKRDFDVIVTDLAMPVADGFSLIRGLRLRNKKMPVIALSAMRGQQVEKEVKEAGFFQHIDKPIEMSYLAATIADAVWQTKNRN